MNKYTYAMSLVVVMIMGFVPGCGSYEGTDIKITDDGNGHVVLFDEANTTAIIDSEIFYSLDENAMEGVIASAQNELEAAKIEYEDKKHPGENQGAGGRIKYDPCAVTSTITWDTDHDCSYLTVSSGVTLTISGATVNVYNTGTAVTVNGTLNIYSDKTSSSGAGSVLNATSGNVLVNEGARIELRGSTLNTTNLTIYGTVFANNHSYPSGFLWLNQYSAINLSATMYFGRDCSVCAAANFESKAAEIKSASISIKKGHFQTYGHGYARTKFKAYSTTWNGIYANAADAYGAYLEMEATDFYQVLARTDGYVVKVYNYADVDFDDIKVYSGGTSNMAMFFGYYDKNATGYSGLHQLKNVTVDYTGTGFRQYVALLNSQNDWTIDNLSVLNVTSSPSNLSKAITARYVEGDLTVTNTTLDYPGYQYAVSVSSLQGDATIDNCIFKSPSTSGTTGAGIGVIGIGRQILIRDSTFTGSTVSTYFDYDVQIGGGTNGSVALFRDNTFHGKTNIYASGVWDDIMIEDISRRPGNKFNTRASSGAVGLKTSQYSTTIYGLDVIHSEFIGNYSKALYFQANFDMAGAATNMIYNCFGRSGNTIDYAVYSDLTAVTDELHQLASGANSFYTSTADLYLYGDACTAYPWSWNLGTNYFDNGSLTKTGNCYSVPASQSTSYQDACDL